MQALFPGYLLIQLDRAQDSWGTVRCTRGVRQIVRFNEYPVPVADEMRIPPDAGH